MDRALLLHPAVHPSDQRLLCLPPLENAPHPTDPPEEDGKQNPAAEQRERDDDREEGDGIREHGAQRGHPWAARPTSIAPAARSASVSSPMSPRATRSR